jgi:hypothetical protein
LPRSATSWVPTADNEAPHIRRDIDEHHHHRQELFDLGRLEVGSRRHGSAAALGQPEVVTSPARSVAGVDAPRISSGVIVSNMLGAGSICPGQDPEAIAHSTGDVLMIN